MTPESGAPNLKPKEIALENLQAERIALKNLAWLEIDSVSGDQVATLLRNIKKLERFLLNAKYSRENVFLPKTEEAVKQNLRLLIGGIINATHPERIEEIMNNPRDFINLLHGKPYEVPSIRERSPAAVKRTEAEPVSAPAEVKELEDPEAQLNRAIEIKDEKMKKIIIVARDLWPDFYFDSFADIKKLFKLSGVEVEVEFFKPDNQNYGMDYIIVYYKDDSKQKGIIVPRSGTILNMTSMFELFSGKRDDTIVDIDTLLEFPEIEKKEIYREGLKWRVTKYGKLRKEAYK